MSASGSMNAPSSSGESKYNGMIKQSWIKILRNYFFDLFSYLDSVVPNFYPMHEVVTVWRMIQFVGPCLCAAHTSIWDPDKTPGRAVSILSIFFHIIPVSYRRAASAIVEFIYCAINILFFIIIIGAAFVYKKSAKLPTALPSILSVYIHTFGYLLHPVNMNLVGEDLGRLIDGQSLEQNMVVEILSIALSLVCFIIWFWFFDQISVISFLFRPNSLLSVLSSTQIFIFITTNLVTFVLAVASQLSKYPSAVLTFIGSILYLLGLSSVYAQGSYISSAHKRLVFASSITSCAFTLVMGIYTIVGRRASFAELLIFFCALVIVYLLSVFILKRSLRRQMRLLDDFQSKAITIDDIGKPKMVVKIGITGMQFAHPAILNWQLFRDATNKWPENVNIWVTFGKFVAIYPNENQLLAHIIYTMDCNKLSGNLAKQTMAQARTVYQQRESSLSTVLKTKLNHSTKHVQVTKRKLRHVWDLAIQGSINEMEASINSAFTSVNKTRSYFNHLLQQYPNNRFVARSYLRFISEVENDPKKFNEWSEKVGNLHRGVSVNADHTNLLGVHAFPGLPPQVSDAYSQPTLTESESFINDTEHQNDDHASKTDESADQINVIRDYIDGLKIPGTTCIKIWNIFLYFILILFPCALMLSILPGYLDSLSQVLYYEYHLSYLRALTIETPVFANHFLCEELGFYPKPLFNMVPEAYGYENETDRMLRFLLSEMSKQVEQVSKYRQYMKKDSDVSKAHSIIFSGIIPYKFYKNQIQNISANSTLAGCVSDVSMQAEKLVRLVESLNCTDPSNVDACWNIQNQTEFLNPYMNYGVICDSITNALRNINSFLYRNVDNVENLCMFICLFVCVVYALIIIGILVYQLENLQKSKIAIYKCLTSLPKNVVSSVSESLRMLKKSDTDENGGVEETETELNKQDENILKIFSSSSDASSMKSLDKTVLIVSSVLFLVCALICTFVIAFTFPEVAEQLNNNSPHLGFILGTSAFGFSTIGALDNLILESNCHGLSGKLHYDCEDPNNDPTTLFLRNYEVNFVHETLSTFITYYNNARFGRESTGLSTVPSYSLYETAVEEADAILDGCENYNISNSAPDYFSCYPVNVQINLFKPVITEILTPIRDGIAIKYNASSPLVQQLWNMMTIGICSKFLYPMFDNIIPEMLKNLNSIIPPANSAVIIVLIIGFINLIAVLFQIHVSETKMRFALSFLTQCPPSVVLSNQKIMEILSGDFSSKSKDVSSHNSQFFDSIVESIPDSVIVCNSNYKVVNTNKSTERIYGIQNKDFIDKDAQEFFSNSSMFIGDTSELFGKSEGNAKIEFKSQNNADNKCFLDINISQMADNYVIVTRDETQTVLYNTLIAEEKVKSDRLLSSILPPNLVKRVQDGEKNISFGVQSATILFLDIVEFTPWCASNTAAMVMSTLNTLFRKFDEKLATHGTMTKIKCIGDCYMCSGGIFVEINQAAVHAKETVEFGLEAISVIEETNKELNLSLRIRVGINTGGPIVAGVLGTEKPTFEILGPAINMAQQMENHGVPMKVHVSRSTYELIYGGNFVIKERGQIEIKRGTVLTYLVEPKK